MTLQKQATIISSCTAFLLICVKFFVGIFSGSVAILASAIDSALDLFASLFNLFALIKSEKPADFAYNYGRGKIESIASVVEGSVIVASGVFILYESFKKLWLKGEIIYINASLFVMIFSFLITLALVFYLSFIAKKTNNLVIKADALHYKTDLLSTGAILLSILIISFSDLHFIDGILGICIGIYIIFSAFALLKNGIFILMDRALDKKIIENINNLLSSKKEIQGFHSLKTRQSGEIYFLEVHLVFKEGISLLKAHEISNNITKDIKKIQGNWEIITHLDPYDDTKGKL